ncbi:MFS transporter [soil metagenome]
MQQENQFSLLRERRFVPFFWTQFLGAFNDNVYKNALVIMFAFQVTSLSAQDANALINLSAAIFILPFFLFSATSGQIADKYEKSRLIRYTVLLEVGLMILGSAGFYLGSLGLLMFTLFLGGVQSALFGPVKYAYLPQHLKSEELVGGNGLVEMGTFVAILLGTVLGGILIGVANWGKTLVSIATVSTALIAYTVSRRIPVTPAPDPRLAIRWNPVTATRDTLRFARHNRTVFLSILGISWFWFYGATFLSQFPNFAKEVLGGDESVVTLLLAFFSIGIGTGSLLCERMSGRGLELGLVPLGSIGLTLFAIDLYFASRGFAQPSTLGWTAFIARAEAWRVVLDLVLIGVFGGFYTVPLYALIQARSDPTHRSRIIAGNNILNALFMVISAGFAIGLGQAGFTVAQVLLLTGIVNAFVALYIYTLVPEFLLRFILWLLIHSVFPISKTGLEHIPKTGTALLRCGSGGIADALIIAAAVRRPIRFVVAERWLRAPLIGFLLRSGGAIALPADPAETRFEQEIAAALEGGDLLCVFTNPQASALVRPLVEIPVIALALRERSGIQPRPRGWRALFHTIELSASPPVAEC